MKKEVLKTIWATLAAVVLVGANSGFADATPRTNEKVTICHRTHATTNPYRQITVSMSSIVGNGNSGNGHGNATQGGGQDDPLVSVDHSHNPYLTAAGPVFNPNYAYPANHKQWQDIIPPFTYVPANGNSGTFAGLNWTDQGKAIYYGYEYNGHNYAGLCSKLSAKQFAQKEYESFIADNPNANAGAKNSAKNDATQDVKDQGNTEDPSLTGKTFDNLPDPVQPPAGPSKPSRVKQLQDDLDTTNQGQQTKKQAIAGLVWIDENADGIQQQSELPSAGTEVKLIDPVTNATYVPTGSTVPTVNTDSSGYFQFEDVPEGNWTVQVTTPTGYSYTYDASGTNDGSMPETYVPSGGVGFTWASIKPISDPNANNGGSNGGNNSGGNNGGSNSGSNSSGNNSGSNSGTNSNTLASTGSNAEFLLIVGTALLAVGAATGIRRRSRPKHRASN